MKKLLCTIWISLVLVLLTECKSPCAADCQNGGTVVEDPCGCNCPSGFWGEFCQNAANVHRLHADVSIDGKPSFAYDPSGMTLDILDHSTDTLWIEGFNDTLGSYCFLRIYVDDKNFITNGTSFPVENSNALGTCWAAFKHPNVAGGQPYFAPAVGGGSVIITDYKPGTFVAGTFDIILELGSSTAHITGWFEDD